MLSFSVDLFLLILSCCIYTTVLVSYFLKRLKSVQEDMKEMVRDRDNELKHVIEDISEIRSSCKRSEHLLRHEMNFSRARYQRGGIRYIETPYPGYASDDVADEISTAFNLITKLQLEENEDETT